MTLENNIKKSFQGVKKDILEVKNQLLNLAEIQEKIITELEALKQSKASKPKTATKKKPAKKTSKRKR